MVEGVDSDTEGAIGTEGAVRVTVVWLTNESLAQFLFEAHAAFTLLERRRTVESPISNVFAPRFICNFEVDNQ